MQLVSADGQFEPYLVNVILVVTLVGGGEEEGRRQATDVIDGLLVTSYETTRSYFFTIQHRGKGIVQKGCEE
jgi:hypothetical protein